MNKMTPKDQKLLAIFAIVAMIGILAIWFPKAKASWTAERTRLTNLQARYNREQTMLKLRPIIQEKYEQLCASMPIFPEGKSVDTYWLPIMDNCARANNVNIAQRSIGSEENLGDVTELTLECRDWDAPLDALVGFLYDLETRKDAMMDIRSITIKPSAKNPGTLQGTFTLNCAYMRQDASK